MDMSTLISSERLNDRRDNSSNGTTTFENRDITQANLGRGWDLFCSYSFNESQRNSQDDTDCSERLYQATDIALIKYPHPMERYFIFFSSIDRYFNLLPMINIFLKNKETFM